MSIKNLTDKAKVYAKLIAYLAKQVTLALSEMGLYGYVKSKDLRAWILKHLEDFIPTKIDDAIINAAVKIDSETVKVLDKVHDKVGAKLKDNSEWTNLMLELNMANDNIKAEKEKKAAVKAVEKAKNAKFKEYVKEKNFRTLYGKQDEEKDKEYEQARQEWVGNNRFRENIFPQDWKIRNEEQVP